MTSAIDYDEQYIRINDTFITKPLVDLVDGS